MKGWEDKKISVVGLAIGGYKQPQQLIIINYFLSLGAKFDLVINLDGYNESTLPLIENFKVGIHPSFPRSWQSFLGAYRSRATLKLMSKKAWVESAQLSWAGFYDQDLFRVSSFMDLVWKTGDFIFESWSQDITRRSLSESVSESFEIQGPEYKFESEEKVLNYSAQIWYQSAKQLALVCKANHIPYFHFLQPNQYDPRSNTKPFSKMEIDKFINKNHPYKRGIELGYPLLLKESGNLLKDKVPFFDFGYVFKNEKETLYVDDSCHLGLRGNALLGSAIGRVIANNIKNQML